MALNDNKDNIIVSGDFNENQLNISNSKVKALLNQFSLTQMIDEPTHFTENFTSLIDLIMTSNVNEISYCCVGPPLADQIRYHCPVIGFLNFLKTPLKAFKLKIWLYDKGDYDLFRNTLSEADWDTIIASDSVDEVTENITNTILQATAISIPNKIITVRKNSPVWLKNDIKKIIRKKNRIHRKAKKFNKQSDWNKFKKIRNKATGLVRKSKEDYNNNRINKIMNGNPSSTNWWKTVKQFSGIKPSDNGIPPIERNGTLIFDDIEKANEFNSYFASQSNLDDIGADNLNNLNDAANNLNEIELNETEIEDALNVLKSF
ncbi:unnamed protein product [Mytilus coruscus]|uniref:Endonuclease/exonuclease/phosphatase domain-containing protein n=1 Tax=Mytilus coruscus TaxID=42192 RepID=A0A6J8BD97_MYTCO|nr:unnamed protein product [Mytilus coruscus]